jgi:hypothetical protein
MDVTLVEPNATYVSNIFSNMVLTGERTLSQLGFNYSTLSSKYGVKVVKAAATAIDPVGRTVTLSTGVRLPYDRLVLSPGIDFEPLPLAGTAANKAKIVHAWKAGAQTTALKAQIRAMSKADVHPDGAAEAVPLPPGSVRTRVRCGRLPEAGERRRQGDHPRRQPGHSGGAVELRPRILSDAPQHHHVCAERRDHRDRRGQHDGHDEFGRHVQGESDQCDFTHKAGTLITESGMGLANARSEQRPRRVHGGCPLQHVLGDVWPQPAKAGHILNEAAGAQRPISPRRRRQNPVPMTNSSCFTPITKTTRRGFPSCSATTPPRGRWCRRQRRHGITDATSENYGTC